MAEQKVITEMHKMRAAAMTTGKEWRERMTLAVAPATVVFVACICPRMRDEKHSARLPVHCGERLRDQW